MLNEEQGRPGDSATDGFIRKPMGLLDKTLVVSNGVATGSARINAPAEILHPTLRRA